MKRITLSVMLLLFSQILSAQLLDTISFSLNDYTFESVETYTRILGPESTYTEMVGYPELPRIEIRYVIPFGKEVSLLTVTDSTFQTLPNRYLLYPKQPDIPLSDPIPSGFALDTLAYRSGIPFPGKTVELVEQFYELGFHVALIHIYPFSYIASQQTLRFCSSVSISLQYSDCASLPVRPEMESRRMFESSKNMVSSIVRNAQAIDSMGGGPRRVIEMNESVPEPHRLLHEASEKMPEYLIITNNHDVDGREIEPYQGQRMTDIFQTLADWKTKKGVPTVVVTVDDICANYTGNDIQAKIHNFLADVYQRYGTMYVLLGGDTNVVPQRTVDTMEVIGLWNDNIQRYIFASDLYYSGVDSDWDYNLNGIYGETEPKGSYNWRDIDKSDRTPNFILARIPASNCSKAAAFVSKSTDYEKMTGIEQSERKYVNNTTSPL